ncbi:hypothetical protein [Streptomyces sp. NPDC040750]|uniref:hypothetical protein n=1 Tax=Streptomyces sp. NPDC040750 TaxID=3154491 RepID=UPI0033E9781A
MPALPPNGAVIPCSALAINTPLQIRNALMTVDFRGDWKHRVDPDPNDPNSSVRLRLVGFKMTAELPGALDDQRGGGDITIKQSDVDVAEVGLLTLTQESPPRYECALMMSPLTMIVNQPGSELLVLSTKDTFRLHGRLTKYPPRGDLFQLQDPVDFVDPDSPDTVVATIQKFPVKVASL